MFLECCCLWFGALNKQLLKHLVATSASRLPQTAWAKMNHQKARRILVEGQLILKSLNVSEEPAFVLTETVPGVGAEALQKAT